MKTPRQEFDIIRFYQNGRQEVIRRGVSESKALAHCNDPETSSQTASKPKGCNGDKEMIDRWHKKDKHWFDGFREARV